MADQPEKKIIVDDDWKAEARREKERLAEEEAQRAEEPLPAPSFPELVNMIVMQAFAGMGMLAGAGGERMPPNLEIAKHFVDMLQVLDDKTKNNLTTDEKKLLDQALYELRMRYVELSTGGGMGGAIPPTSAGS
ncbi:MAG: DUF1844 domain-containing protein [Phycisphaerae bacterium]|nr:DUF1844 domain-containing protein [Phycisphaerae bacterium]